MIAPPHAHRPIGWRQLLSWASLFPGGSSLGQIDPNWPVYLSSCWFWGGCLFVYYLDILNTRPFQTQDPFNLWTTFLFFFYNVHMFLILINYFLGLLGFYHYMKKQILCPIKSHEDSALPFHLTVYSFTPVFLEVFDLSGLASSWCPEGGMTLSAFLCWDPAVPPLSWKTLLFFTEWSWHPIRGRAHGHLAVFLHSQLSSTAFCLWAGLSVWCREVCRFYSLASSWSRVAPWPMILTCLLARAGDSVTLHILLSTFKCKPCSNAHSRKFFCFCFFTS